MGSLIFSHMMCCNGRKFQSSWGFVPNHNWWVYSVSYGPMRFWLCKNKKTLYRRCLWKVWELPATLARKPSFALHQFHQLNLLTSLHLPVQDKYPVYVSYILFWVFHFALTLSFMIVKNYSSVSFGETIQPWVKGIHPRTKLILICDQFKFKYEKLEGLCYNYCCCFFLKWNETGTDQNI